MKADHDYKIERFQEAFNKFKEATGVDLMSERGDPIWDIKGAGEAVKVLMAMRHRPVERLRELAQGLRDAGAIVEAALNAVDVPDKPSTAPKQ
jgi:hypothetical protein